MDNTVMNRRQVAAELGVQVTTVRAWERAGKLLPKYHINGRPRYSIEAVNAMKKITKAIY